ncbi:MAG: Nucleoside-triphosphatase rdgB [Gemmatimonadetes bacterium]|nr:Nucleoside-triphosphatase rdgB [Gemmatimonadota bacterium]
MLPLVVATRNSGKLHELRALFATHGIHVVDLNEVGVAEDVVAEERIESFDTFEENALAKARYFAGRLPGRMIVADDSGLCVDALDGRPGVRSKRWSGAGDLSGGALVAANNAKLIAELHGVSRRTARFVCAAAFSSPAGEVVVRGEVGGHILEGPRGTHGFGYDPLFFATDLGTTLAEATSGEKERVSHRGRAFAKLLNELRPLGLVELT